MPYRNELEAAQARVSSLERELADARAELDGAKSTALVPVGSQALARAAVTNKAATRWLGAPLKLELSATLEGELPDTAYTELVEALRQAFSNAGTTTVLPGSLAWATVVQNNGVGPHINVFFTTRSGSTVIRMEQKLGQSAGVIFGAIGGGVGGGGVMAPIATMWINPLLLPVALAAWFGATYWACRRLFRSRAKKHAGTLERVLDELSAIARDHIDRATAAAAAAE